MEYSNYCIEFYWILVRVLACDVIDQMLIVSDFYLLRSTQVYSGQRGKEGT